MGRFQMALSLDDIRNMAAKGLNAVENTDNATEIRWNTVLTEEEALRLIGMGKVEAGRAFCRDMTATECRSRAVGAWTANERESYVAWTSLAIARGGKVL